MIHPSTKRIIVSLLVISCALLVILGWEPITAATRKIPPAAFTGKATVKQVSKTSLLGAWDFNECATCTTAADLSGNARNGTTYTGFGTTEINLRDSDGIRGRSVLLDGSNDTVSIADNDAWSFAGDFTISVWTKFTSVNSAGDWWETGFVNHDNGGGQQNKWIFSHDGVSGTTLFHINNPGGGCNVEMNSTAWTPATGVWYHLVVERVGNTFAFYKDGKLNGTEDSACAVPNSTTPLVFGHGEGSTKSFDGRIDEVKMYSRALSAGEIERLYNENKIPPRVKQLSGLVGHWTFDYECPTCDYANDISSNNLQGLTYIDNGSTRGDRHTPGGVLGRAASFPGTSDQMFIADNAYQDFTGDMTISFWMNSANDAGSLVLIFHNDPNTLQAITGWYIFHNNTGGIGFGGLGDVGCAFDECSTGINFADSTWHLATFTRTGGFIKVYKDGAEVASTAVSGTSANSDNGVYVSRPANAQDYNGKIDDIRFYNRALSQPEIMQLYRAAAL